MNAVDWSSPIQCHSHLQHDCYGAYLASGARKVGIRGMYCRESVTDMLLRPIHCYSFMIAIFPSFFSSLVWLTSSMFTGLAFSCSLQVAAVLLPAFIQVCCNTNWLSKNYKTDDCFPSNHVPFFLSLAVSNQYLWNILCVVSLNIYVLSEVSSSSLLYVAFLFSPSYTPMVS